MKPPLLLRKNQERHHMRRFVHYKWWPAIIEAIIVVVLLFYSALVGVWLGAEVDRKYNAIIVDGEDLCKSTITDEIYVRWSWIPRFDHLHFKWWSALVFSFLATILVNLMVLVISSRDLRRLFGNKYIYELSEEIYGEEIHGEESLLGDDKEKYWVEIITKEIKENGPVRLSKNDANKLLTYILRKVRGLFVTNGKVVTFSWLYLFIFFLITWISIAGSAAASFMAHRYDASASLAQRKVMCSARSIIVQFLDTFSLTLITFIGIAVFGGATTYWSFVTNDVKVDQLCEHEQFMLMYLCAQDESQFVKNVKEDFKNPKDLRDQLEEHIKNNYDLSKEKFRFNMWCLFSD